MKSIEKKEQYVALRGAGNSIRTTCKELDISTSTGQEWEKELKERVEQEKADHLSELHTMYGMMKEKRIERIGNTLNKITDAIQGIDLRTLPPDKLLDLQLKYIDKLKEEYVPPRAKIEAGENTRDTLFKVLLDTADKVRTGDLTPEQAKNETQSVANLLKAIEQSGLTQKEDMPNIRVHFVDNEYKSAYVDAKTGVEYFTKIEHEYEDRDAYRKAHNGEM